MRSRTPLRYRRIVVRAEGDERVEAVVHAAVDRDWRVVPGSEQRTTADALCVGYGFFPSVELLRLAGCELGYDEDLGGPVAVRDAWMRTTVPGVFAAGDGTGVSGSHVAIAEGRLAALAIALDLGALDVDEVDRRARPIRSAMRRKLAFARSLRGLHAIGPGIYELATDGHRRLPLRERDPATARRGGRRDRPTSASSRASRAPAWGSARDATASARSPR